MPGPETLAAPAPDEGVPQSDTKPAAEQQAADSVPVEQAKAVVAAKQAEVIAQETGKVELGSMPGKSFVTSAELQQIDKTTNPANKAADELAQVVASSKAALPGLAKEHAAEQQTVKRSETVRVQRTSGDIEDDWKLVGIRDGRAIVTKPDTYKNGDLTGRMLRKAIPVSELSQMNPDLKLIDPNRPTTPDFLRNVPVPNTEPEIPSKPATPDFLKNVPVPNTEPELSSKPTTPDFLKNVPVPNTEDESVLAAPESTKTAEVIAGSAQERFNTLQQELIATMAQKGVTAELYRQGNRVSAEYTDKDGKSIGLESIRTIFGAEQTLKIADLAGKLEVALYTNPELSQELAARETSSEKVSRLASASIDRLGAAMRSKADQLKPKGLWAQAKGWFNRGKDRITNVATSFQAKAGEIRRQRGERRVAANFQKFANTFNLLTPAMLSADKAMVDLNRDIDGKSQEFIKASDTVSQLSEEIRRLKVMEARLGRMKEIRSLEKRRDTFQKQVNMLRGQLAKLSTNYNTVDQELKRQQALEQQSLADQLRAKNPLKPGYVGPEIPDRAPATEPAAAREPYVGPEIDEASSTNAPDDRTAPMGTRQPYYSQEQEMTDVTTAATTASTDFDRSQAKESVPSVDTAPPARTIPLGPPAAPAAPEPTTPPPSTPEAQSGEAA